MYYLIRNETVVRTVEWADELTRRTRQGDYVYSPGAQYPWCIRKQGWRRVSIEDVPTETREAVAHIVETLSLP